MSAPTILVIGPSWVGDMVMAQSLFLALKQADPDCQIDVLAPAWSFALLERMPEVRKAIAMPLTHGQLGVGQRFSLGKKLRAEAYDQAIVLPNSWKSALVPFFAGIPKRTGYLGEARWGLLNDARSLDKQLLTMTVQRFVALALAPDAPLPPTCPTPALTVSAAQQQAVIDTFDLDTVHPKILALCPGAEYGPAKRWPASHFAEIARHKLDQGWQVWLFGSEKDQAVAAQINHDVSGFCQDFTGRTTLGEAVDLLSLAHTVVSNDSGLMHVAAALNKRLIALYGSSDPGFTPPLNSQAHILSLNLDCSPCFKRECPLGHTRCLVDLSPQQVLDLITIRTPHA
ncbi:lipopolysaccharide heptosyltransferase II [Methylosoma difficile]